MWKTEETEAVALETLRRAMKLETFDCPVSSFVVVDGDTQHVVLDRGFRVTLGITTRLQGIDAPEINTQAGKLVADIVFRWLTPICQTKYRLRWLSRDLDMYGRSIGDFIDREHPGESLSNYLVKNKLARDYDGKAARKPWSVNDLIDVERIAKEIISPNAVRKEPPF